MASPASLASLGSVRPSPSGIFDVGPSNGAVPRNRLVSRVSFTTLYARWSYARGGVCNCMVSTGLVEDSGIKVSSNSDLRETSNGSTSTSTSSSNRSGLSNADFGLKPAPKPALIRPSAPAPVPPQRQPVDRKKLALSLDEALEKVEKLEMNPPPVQPVTREVRNNSRNNVSYRPGSSQRAVNTPVKNPNAFKSVWKKGESVAPVQQKVVKEVPKVEIRREVQIEQVPEKEKEEEEEEEEEEEKDKKTTMTEIPKPERISATTPSSSAKLPPMVSPMRPQAIPKLQSRPSVAPPASPARPAPPVAPIQVQKPDVPKERKGPILIDKYAAKRPVADPLNSDEEQSILSTKPAKGPQKFRRAPAEQIRRKSDEKGRGGRRQFQDDIDTNEGMPAKRISRRRRRTMYREAREQEEEEEEPVRAEIIEVGEEGMSLDELAESLALTRSALFHFMFTRGIKGQVLGKDAVKLLCREYGVEVLDAGSRLTEMAKKKEVLDEEDLDSLETRPPVVTIMGHVDHGKVGHGVIC